jgi:hypothetical protein
MLGRKTRPIPYSLNIGASPARQHKSRCVSETLFHEARRIQKHLPCELLSMAAALPRQKYPILRLLWPHPLAH